MMGTPIESVAVQSTKRYDKSLTFINRKGKRNVERHPVPDKI
jgi:hypothetical protein